MLQFILGPSHAGKTEQVYTQLQDRLAQGQPSWILVPEQFSLYTEKEILRRFGLPAQKKIKVLSFSRLCNLVLHQTGPLRMRYIDGAGKHMIAKRIIQTSADDLLCLRHNLHQKGFASTLTETFSECKRYGVTPQALTWAAQETDHPELSQKIQELATLYTAFNELIELHHADAEDNLTLIIPKIRQCHFLQGMLYVMHFRSFTPVEYQVLGQLMQMLSVCMVFDYSDLSYHNALYAPIAHTVKTLRDLAREHEVRELPPTRLHREEATSALSYLQTRYFDDRAKPYTEEQNQICFYESQNRYREMESAADLILRLCRTQGLRFRDFLILSRNTETYARMMPQIFQSRGVKLFIDSRRNILSAPLTRLILSTLEILAYGPSYERIISMARTELLPLSRDEIDRFENYLLATAPTPAMWQTDTWDYLPAVGDYDIDSINHVKTVLLSGVQCIQDQISGTKTGGEIAEALLSWLRRDDMTERLLSHTQSTASDASEYAEESRQVLQSLLSALAQLSAIMHETPLTYRAFYELFSEICGGIDVGLTPQTLDCVIFSQIDRFRSSGAKVVLVLDATEGVFPKGYQNEGFLSDAERHVLKQVGITLAPGQSQKRQEEQLLINAVINAPTERLYLFRPLTDEDGKVLQPSEIFKRISALIPSVTTVRPDTESDPLRHIEGKTGAFYLLSSALAECGGDPQALSLGYRAVYAHLIKDPDFCQPLTHLCASIRALPPTALSPSMIQKLYQTPLNLSASQLETYQSCAFSYFLTYGLLLKERATAEPEPRSMGSIQHAAIYDYFSALANRGTDFSAITKDDCFQSIGQAVEQEAKKNKGMLFEASSYYRYIVFRMKEITARTAWEVVKFYQSSDFQPFGYEIKIGDTGGIPALSVHDLNGKEIAKIKGLIDRADVAEVNGTRYINIIDYKSSAKNLDVTLAKDGIAIQPLLYAEALCRQTADSAPAAMFYLQMNDPILPEEKIKKGIESAIDAEMKPRGWIVDDASVHAAYCPDGQETFMPKAKTSLISKDELNRRIEEANRTISSAAIQIADGCIEAAPYRSPLHDACQYCAYRGICQKHL